MRSGVARRMAGDSPLMTFIQISLSSVLCRHDRKHIPKALYFSMLCASLCSANANVAQANSIPVSPSCPGVVATTRC